MVSNGSSTFFRLSDGVFSNQGFGKGQLLAELHGTTGLATTNISLNIGSGNQAHVLFG